MTATSSHHFISQFFAERLQQQQSSYRSSSDSGASHPRGPRSIYDPIGCSVEDSSVTEAFLHRLCRTHRLASTAELFLFLISEEPFVLRAAQSDRGDALDQPAVVPTASSASSSSASSRRRPREGEVAVGSAFLRDGLLTTLMHALSRQILSQNGAVPTPLSSHERGPLVPFPSLDQGPARPPQTDKREEAPAARTRATFYSTGCPGVDALLSPNAYRGPSPETEDAAGIRNGEGAVEEEDGEAVLRWLRPGGFRSHQLTELSGEAGTGKTLVALQVAVTYIARKLGADIVCRYFASFADASGDGEGEPQPADRSEEEVVAASKAGDGAEREADGPRQRQHPLRPYWAAVKRLLACLHYGEANLFPAAADEGAVGREGLSGTLRLVRRRASPICCLYLVSEDVPAARLSSLAAGAVKALSRLLTRFFAPLLPSPIYSGFARALRAGLTLESVLNELKVRPFSSLEELLALVAMPDADSGAGAATRPRQGQLINVIEALQRRGDTNHGPHPPATTDATPRCGGGGGGIVVFDSIAAAAMQSAEASRDERDQLPNHPQPSRAGGRYAAEGSGPLGGRHRRRRRRPHHTLLGRVGADLRRLAAHYGLCVLVTNQVRSRVVRRLPALSGSALLDHQPLVRLKEFQGLLRAGAAGSRRAPRPDPGNATGSTEEDGAGAAGWSGRDADPVPALGLPWAVAPHSRVFLRKLAAAAVTPTGSGSLRELILTASPFAPPGAVAYVITADGMRQPADAAP